MLNPHFCCAKEIEKANIFMSGFIEYIYKFFCEESLNYGED